MIDKNLSLALGTSMHLMNYKLIDHKIAAGVLAGLIIGKVGRDLTADEFTYNQELISKENLTIW